MKLTRKVSQTCPQCSKLLTQEYYPDENYGNTGGIIEGLGPYCDNPDCPEYGKSKS